MKVAIAVPYNNPVTVHWAMSLACLNIPINRSYHSARDARVDFARNTLAQKAIDSQADWLWFIDSDTIPPANAFLDLFKTASENKAEIVSGITFTKTIPSHPNIMKKQGDFYKFSENLPTEEVFETEAVGMACCLIQTSVLKKLKKPWFAFTEYISEDEYFCEKARNAGYKILINNKVRCQHLGEYIYTEKDSISSS